MPTGSARRVPLSSNPNAANSPLRAAAPKAKRSYATVQREEQYGQPPPLKKQMLENGAPRTSRSPTQSRTRPALQTTRLKPKAPSTADSTHHQKPQDKDRDLVSWQKQYRARFPRMVFYFDSVPDDIRARLVKPIVYLGAVSHFLCLNLGSLKRGNCIMLTLLSFFLSAKRSSSQSMLLMSSRLVPCLPPSLLPVRHPSRLTPGTMLRTISPKL